MLHQIPPANNADRLYAQTAYFVQAFCANQQEKRFVQTSLSLIKKSLSGANSNDKSQAVMKTSKSLSFSPGFKQLLLLIASVNSLIGIKRIAESFFAPEIFKKDIIQEYLMAKAILNGVNPYLPLPELASRWVIEANDYNGLKHPTPHTPFIGILSIPLGFLNYKAAAMVWLGFEIVCLFIVVSLLCRWWKRKPVSIKLRVAVLLFSLGWLPITEDIWFGQLSICLLLLLTGTWLALQKKCDWLAGSLLGGVFALKLIAWPLIFYLILCKKWRSVLAAGTVISLANLLAIIVIGKYNVMNYYFEVVPQIATLYKSMDANISAWTIGHRFFSGFGTSLLILPFWQAPSLAKGLTYFIPLIILAIGLRIALMAKSFDSSFSVLIGISILVSPIVWTHYLILAVIPIIVLIQRLFVAGLPRSVCYVTFCLLLSLMVNNLGYVQLSLLFSTHSSQEGVAIVPFTAGLFTLIPFAALIVILWLLWQLETKSLSSSYE